MVIGIAELDLKMQRPLLPGPKTITNASHNVVIDFFAYGGFPLLIAYLGNAGFWPQ
jgi:hypothetical protein